MVVPPPQAAPQQPTGTVAKRRKVASVTIMPESKRGSRMSDPAQLAMVQAGIIQMKPPGLLTRWQALKRCTRGHYASELSSKNHAHFQGWHEWDTEQPQSEVPEQLLEAVRNASGKRKTELEQKIRNTLETGAVSELRKCAAAAPLPRVQEHLAHYQRARACWRRWLRTDVIEKYLDLEACTYSCTINIVKEGDEVKTMGYPGKEEGQIHLKTAVIGISDEELRHAIEVEPLAWLGQG